MTEPNEPTIRNFTDLIVWQKSHRLHLDSLQDVKTFPEERGTRELADQLLRCVGSIAANIAEGFGSDGATEYCRYLTIARKSCAEAHNWFLIAGDAGYISEKDARAKSCEEISRMLYSLREKLKNRSNGNGQARGERFRSGPAGGYQPRAEWRK